MTVSFSSPILANTSKEREMTEKADENKISKSIREISNWFELDLKGPEAQYVMKLKRVREVFMSLRDLVTNRTDCTLSLEDVNVIFFEPHLNFILEFHSFWNEKRLKHAHEAWTKSRDLIPLADAFDELCGGRGRPLTRYTPLLQAKWDSDRVFRRLREDGLALERLRREKISIAELQNLLCAPHTQLMRYKMKFSTLVKFVERSSHLKTNISKFHNVLKRLEMSTKQVNENAIWAPVMYTKTLFSRDPFNNKKLTFRGRDGEVRVRNFKYTVQIKNQTLDIYLLQGSMLISSKDQICLDCLSWARVEGMSVSSKKKKDTFEICAKTYGGKFWENSRITVVVLQRDSLAGNLEEELRKLQRDSKGWCASDTTFSNFDTLKQQRYHVDVNARLRCVFVVLFFVLVYVLGIVIRECVAEEHDAISARSSAPQNVLSYLANNILRLFGYFIPYGVVVTIRIMENDDASIRDEILSDSIRWLTLWIMSRFIVEPMSNILCPVLTMGTRSFTVGYGRKGVASHTLMTIVAWGYAALGSSGLKIRGKYYYTRMFTIIALIYAWMGYVTARHYHYWDEIVAACIVGTSVLLVYIYILDAIDRNRRSITIVGSSTSTKKKDGVLQVRFNFCSFSSYFSIQLTPLSSKLGCVYCNVVDSFCWCVCHCIVCCDKANLVSRLSFGKRILVVPSN
jgi:hypothetical protein